MSQLSAFWVGSCVSLKNSRGCRYLSCLDLGSACVHRWVCSHLFSGCVFLCFLVYLQACSYACVMVCLYCSACECFYVSFSWPVTLYRHVFVYVWTHVLFVCVLREGAHLFPFAPTGTQGIILAMSYSHPVHYVVPVALAPLETIGTSPFSHLHCPLLLMTVTDISVSLFLPPPGLFHKVDRGSF